MDNNFHDNQPTNNNDKEVIKKLVEKLENNESSGFAGWDQYGRYVLKQLENFEQSVNDLYSKFDELKDDFQKLQIQQTITKVRIALIGAVAGFLASWIPILIRLFIYLKEM